MNYEDIQRIVVVYGSKDNINLFIGANEQAFGEAEKIDMVELKGDNKKEVKKLIWKGD